MAKDDSYVSTSLGRFRQYHPVVLVPPYRESALRRIADTPTLKMMELWKSETRQVVGQSIEIMAGNRRNNKVFQSIQGQLNTAVPEKYRGQLVLILWLDVFPNPNMIILTHEIGHWVLKLQGYRNLFCNPRDVMREMLVNDVAMHVPLYNLQRSIGHEPQDEIDSRTENDIHLIEKANSETTDSAAAALLFTDDILNCSEMRRRQMKSSLKNFLPDVLGLVDEVTTEAHNYDVLNPLQNVAFKKSLVKKLGLGGQWDVADDVETLRRHVRQISV